MTATFKWHVFYCASRTEKKAASLLEKAGYDVFLPLNKTLRQWSDRKKWVELPLFPGYIFVWCDQAQISKVSQAPGVVGPLRLAGEYGCLSEQDVQNIEQILLTGNPIETETRNLLPGDTVLIEYGPLRGIKGIVMNEAGKDFFYVQIETLNQYIKIRIASAAIKKDASKKSH